MNLAHVHIVLNHVPSLGSIAGLLLLAAGIYKKDEAIKQFAYGVLVLITMAVLPTYITPVPKRSGSSIRTRHILPAWSRCIRMRP
jgi:hypothetical protein